MQLASIYVRSKLNTSTSFLSKGIIINLTETDNVDVIVGNWSILDSPFFPKYAVECVRGKKHLAEPRRPGPAKSSQRLFIDLYFPLRLESECFAHKKTRG